MNLSKNLLNFCYFIVVLVFTVLSMVYFEEVLIHVVLASLFIFLFNPIINVIDQTKVLRFSYFFIILAIFVLGITFYRAILTHILFACIFVFLFNPVVSLIEQLGVKRTPAVLLFFLIFFLNIFLIGSLILPAILNQLRGFAEAYTNFIYQENPDFFQLPLISYAQSFIENLQALLPFIDFEALGETFIERSNDVIGRIPGIILNLTGDVAKVAGFLFFVPLISFFLLRDHISLKKRAFSLIPNKYFEITVIIIDKMRETVGIYIRALFIQMMIYATLNSLLLSIVGIRYSLLIGIMSGMLNVIPNLGPTIAIVIGGLIALLTGATPGMIIATIIVMTCVNLFDNVFVYPTIMGKNTNLPPVVIIMTVLAGGTSFGFIGMIVSVPLVFLIVRITTLIYTKLKEFEMI